MAKRTMKKGPKQVETLTHDAARRKNIPSAEHASIAERFEELHPFEPVTYARANPLAQGATRIWTRRLSGRERKFGWRKSFSP